MITILVVDDEPLIREAVVDVLRSRDKVLAYDAAQTLKFGGPK